MSQTIATTSYKYVIDRCKWTHAVLLKNDKTVVDTVTSYYKLELRKLPVNKHYMTERAQVFRESCSTLRCPGGKENSFKPDLVYPHCVVLALQMLSNRLNNSWNIFWMWKGLYKYIVSKHRIISERYGISWVAILSKAIFHECLIIVYCEMCAMTNNKSHFVYSLCGIWITLMNQYFCVHFVTINNKVQY